MKQALELLLISSLASASILEITSDSKAIFNNGYVSATVNLIGGAPWISELYGDWQGKSKFGANLLAASGVRLERENSDGSVVSAANVGTTTVAYSVTQNDDSCGSIDVKNVVDDLTSPSVTESWQLTLCAGDRFLNFASTGRTLYSDTPSKVRSIRHGLYATPLSTTAFFHSGVVQIMGARAAASHFASADQLGTVYFLGGTGSISVKRPNAPAAEEGMSVLLNRGEGADYVSGFQELLVGNYSLQDIWGPGSAEEDSVTPEYGTQWSTTWQLYPNSKNFPSSELSVHASSNLDDDADVEAFMVGVYANAVPCLCTYKGEVTPGMYVAQIATSLRYDMLRGYDGTYNYFDPDNFFTLSAILYSGDPYLQKQAKDVIERTGTFILSDNGQLPHHFNGVHPYYLALSGETQTGPNTFWTMTALRYAAVTGDKTWLAKRLPTLRSASSFVFDLISADKNMVLAPGSLMIDVFIRNNYTSDSNAMVVGFLREFASAERLVGNATRAAELEATADKVVAAVNAYLWADASAGEDHYITQLNTDGTTRDFIDYDSNLIAIANGVSDEARSRAIQKRVDAGQCSAASGGGAQFVSERYYGVDDTTSGNTGDSWCAMARIGWFDARGRKRFGSAEDLAYFEERILKPVQTDLMANTWMHERYGCDGTQQQNRTMYYFEYPSFVTMLLREIKYGVQTTLDAVSVEPFGTTSSGGFEYHFGDTDVSYAPAGRTSISVPGSGLFPYQVKGLPAGASYAVTKSDDSCGADVEWTPLTATASAEGVLAFTAPRLNYPCAIHIDLSSTK